MISLLLVQTGLASGEKEGACDNPVLYPPSQSLTIEIEPVLYNTSIHLNGHNLQAYQAYLVHPKGKVLLEQATALGNRKLKNLQVLYNGEGISLSKKMSTRLLAWLNQSHENLDCHEFITFFTEINFSLMAHAVYRHYPTLTSTPDEKLFRPGDGVAFGNRLSDPEKRSSTCFESSAMCIEHSAMFLSPGVYLSKIGKKGPVMITNYEEIMKFYQTDSVLRIPLRIAR